ncbi:MAG: chorismate-binding protein [Leptospirales bacterium]
MKKNSRIILSNLESEILPDQTQSLYSPAFDPVALLARLRERDPLRPLLHIDRERSSGWSHVPVDLSRVVSDRVGESFADHPLLSCPAREKEGTSLRIRQDGIWPPFSSGVVLLLPFEMAELWEPSGGPFLGPQVPAVRCDCRTVVSFHAPTGRLFLPPGFDHSLLDPVALPPVSLPAFSSSDSPEVFAGHLDRIRSGLSDGRYFQVNLARRFEAPLPEGFDPLAAYARMRKLGPSPFGGFFSHRGRFLLSRSPEQFLSGDGDRLVTRPIAGTLAGPPPSGGEEPLLRDPKLLAEHIMTVDLLRNDLGRVCRPGSVRVSRLLAVETLPHLRHLVSDVEGRLAPHLSRKDLLCSLFPGGSVTGAPRIAVRREIGRLEGRPRNDYCGIFGYVSETGQMDFSLLIRTIEGLMEPSGGRISFGAGAGIVADSVAEEEIREIALKARTMEEVFR